MIWTSKSLCLIVSVLLLLLIEFMPGSPSMHDVRAAAGAPWKRTVKNDNSGPKILLIGHSKFYWHDMPRMLADMLGSQPAKISYVFGNAYSLEDHWNTKLAQKTIASDRPRWDYIVLIEQTWRAEKKPELFEKYAKRFDVQAKLIGAKTLIVESYTDKVEDYEKRHRVMLELTKKLNVELLPVGTAWNAVRTKSPKIKLYSPDGHHPSIQGTYLISAMIYSYIFRKSPESLPTKLRYTDRRSRSSTVFKSLDDCKSVQKAVSKALKDKQ